MGAEGKVWGRVWKGALGLVYPPQCAACDTPVARQGALCPDCWREARFITGPACACCGLPLAPDGGAVVHTPGGFADAASGFGGRGFTPADRASGLARPPSGFGGRASGHDGFDGGTPDLDGGEPGFARPSPGLAPSGFATAGFSASGFAPSGFATAGFDPSGTAPAGFASAFAAPPFAERVDACDPCRHSRRPWSRGVAAMVYEGTGRKLVLALKHGDRPDLARGLGDWLSDAVAPVRDAAMIVVPIPVHPARMIKRRYNQAALIAARLAVRLDLPHHPAALRRVRHTPMQDHRTLDQRFANQAGAIALRPSARGLLAGRPVLLVDDVMASGATMSAAGEALIAGGAGPITVAVVARALRDGRIDAPAEALFG